ncbi:MAG: type II toxin-antitoxin system prevent-host-death family antitoxin [Deltaproteobacteria bacterium]|nr:type II toxin-antitoxin system prevent-host-death family antitoxin [Deltaproteobacteria bacterium]
MKVDEIGVFDAKAHLSELIRKVMSGQTFYITRRGKRVAELRPVLPEKRPLSRGCARNDEYSMSADFNEPLEDLEEYM